MPSNQFSKINAKAIENELQDKFTTAEGVADPQERLAELKGLNDNLRKIYDHGAPVSTLLFNRARASHKKNEPFFRLAVVAALIGSAAGAIPGVFFGTFVGVSTAAAAFSVPVMLGFVVAGAALGFGTIARHFIKELRGIRKEQGTLRHARKIYKIEKQVDKAIRTLSTDIALREQFDGVFKKQPAGTPAAALKPAAPRL